MGNEASQCGKKIENDIKVEWAKEIVKCPYVPREGQTCAVVESKLYFFGGVTPLPDDSLEDEAVMETDELIIFDSTLREWSKETAKGACWPGQRSGATMTAVNRNLYLFGGLSQLTGWLNDMFVYNTETKEWKEVDVPDAPSPRDKVASVAVGDKIYLFGGFGPATDPEANPDNIVPDDDDDDEYEDIDELQDVRNCQDAANFTWSNQLYIFDTTNWKWSLIDIVGDAVPSPRAAHTLTHIKEKLFVFGGRDAQSRRNDLWKFDLNKTRWEECKCAGYPPQPRSFHAASSAGSRLFVYGGRGMKDQHFNDLNIYDTGTSEWLQPSSHSSDEKSSGDALIPPAVGLHSLCCTEKSLMLFGGSSDLDPATGTCIHVYNDIYTIPVGQLLTGGSIKRDNDAKDEKSEKPPIPGLVELQPKHAKNESNS